MLEVTSVPENSSSNSRGHGFVVDKAITSQGMKKQALRAARSPDADHEAIDLALSLLTRDHVKAHHPGLHEATHVADVDSDPSELVSLPDDAFNGSLRLAWQSRVRA